MRETRRAWYKDVSASRPAAIVAGVRAVAPPLGAAGRPGTKEARGGPESTGPQEGRLVAATLDEDWRGNR